MASQPSQTSHLLACTTAQLNAHPTTAQKSSARAHIDPAPAISSSISGSPSPPSANVPLRPPNRVPLSKCLYSKALSNFAATGPTSRFVRRRRERARAAASAFSGDLARVVRVGWVARVAQRERCDGFGRWAGALGIAVPDVRRVVRRVRAWLSGCVVRSGARQRVNRSNDFRRGRGLRSSSPK